MNPVPGDNGISVILTCAAHDLEDLQSAATADRAAAYETQDQLADLERRLDSLNAAHGPQATQHNPNRVSGRQPIAARTWDEIVADAHERLEARGINMDEVQLDDLLDPAEVTRIERRYRGGFEVRAELDCYDITFAVVAGLAAAIVDVLLVGIPRDMRWNDGHQAGSWLTTRLRDLSVPDDNWLADIAKVPFDKIAGYGQIFEGIGPKTHRAQTFGHDPLFGLLIGTLDIMRGTMTGVSKTGHVASVLTGDAPVRDPSQALALEILHLLSDVPTRMGLPVPGWSLLMSLPFGQLGPNDQTVAELARQMYLRGYDTWHFLTMATSVAAVHLVLRGYWGLRSHLDPEFAEDVRISQQVANTDRLCDHPRFQAMSLAAHGIATAGNLAKVALYQNNPLAINYAQWLEFVRSFFSWSKGRLATPTELLTSQGFVNSIALADGWVGLDPDNDFARLRLPRVQGTTA
jgi:hypothetical protein